MKSSAGAVGNNVCGSIGDFRRRRAGVIERPPANKEITAQRDFPGIARLDFPERSGFPSKRGPTRRGFSRDVFPPDGWVCVYSLAEGVGCSERQCVGRSQKVTILPVRAGARRVHTHCSRESKHSTYIGRGVHRCQECRCAKTRENGTNVSRAERSLMLLVLRSNARREILFLFAMARALVDILLDVLLRREWIAVYFLSLIIGVFNAESY